ncbi:MAG TPA: hypothetical protein VLI72_17145 [Methylibium sp.]|nr:hypothetical protein [Methylibium sp.]
MKHHGMLCGLALLALLASCGKVQEAATEKAIEAELQKSGGGSAKVDLSATGTQITTTDAAGKTTQMQMGGAQVGEADVGLPFYPGSKPLEGGASRITTPEGSMISIGLHSDDAPAKVAEFYRGKLKAQQAAGKQFMDMSGGDGGATLMLADDQQQSATQVHVSKAEQGTDFQIVANRKAAP